jgi:hypothetical protein
MILTDKIEAGYASGIGAATVRTSAKEGAPVITANIALSLGSPAASYLAGQTSTVDAGYSSSDLSQS